MTIDDEESNKESNELTLEIIRRTLRPAVQPLLLHGGYQIHVGRCNQETHSVLY
jgi:hypothetical protein